MSKLGQHYINEHDELGIITDYPDGDVAVVSWFRKDARYGVHRHTELRYLPNLTPIESAVADIMLEGWEK